MPEIPEDHRFEQFFFDAATTRRLAAEAMRHRRPLLLCLPSIAEALEAAGHPYTLLDRDTRFSHLSGWQRWDLQKPELVFEDFDAILCGPDTSSRWHASPPMQASGTGRNSDAPRRVR